MSVPEPPAERVPSASAADAAPGAPPLSASVLPLSAAGPAPGIAPAPSDSVTATFLMTDIEGSTRLWAEERDAMTRALAAHDALLREAVGVAGGHVFKTTGDGMLAVFDRSDGAVEAALAAQRGLAAHAWPTGTPLLVRMAIHAGTADVRDGDYFGRRSTGWRACWRSGTAGRSW
jgi:class 3 adenylate cyclase